MYIKKNKMKRRSGPASDPGFKIFLLPMYLQLQPKLNSSVVAAVKILNPRSKCNLRKEYAKKTV